MADETLAVRAAEALPGWAGSIRFRLMVLYSVLLFGLATVVVGGKYYTNPSMAGGFDEMLAITDHLIDKVRAERER